MNSVRVAGDDSEEEEARQHKRVLAYKQLCWRFESEKKRKKKEKCKKESRDSLDGAMHLFFSP
jgi:hypothetical protein